MPPSPSPRREPRTAGLLALALLVLSSPAVGQVFDVRASGSTTAPPGTGRARAAAIWRNPAAPGDSAILVAEESAGLGIYGLDGVERQRLAVSTGAITGVAVARQVPSALGIMSLVATVNPSDDTLSLWTIDPGTLELSSAIEPPFTLTVPVETLAFGESPDGTGLLLVGVDRTGNVQQWQVDRADAGALGLTPVRSFALASGSSGLAADNAQQRLFIGEELFGLQSFPLAPDGGTTGVTVDTVGTGRLGIPTSGVALYEAGATGGYVLVGSASVGNVTVYQRLPLHASPGAARLLPADGGAAPLVVRGVAVEPQPLGEAFPEGLLVTTDPVSVTANSRAALTSWGDFARAFTPPLVSQGSTDGGVDGGGVDGGGVDGGGVDGGVGADAGVDGGGGAHTGNLPPDNGIPTPPDEGGCNCSAAGSLGGLLGLMALGLLRRRRSRY